VTPVSTGDLFRVFGRIGVLSFGGPAAQIALMHDELVDRRGWLSEAEFLRALSLCMLLPGPEAMQLATYSGWRLRGTFGGLIAGLLFVLPGACIILALALGYTAYGQVPLVQAAFVGIKATVIVIVLQALLKVARRALTTRRAWALAACAFAALFVFGLPFPVIVVAAGAFGALNYAGSSVQAVPEMIPPARTLPVICLWTGLWVTPLLALWVADQAFLLQIGLFFSKLAVVTFGGAYAVLAYMTQTVVQDFGWITTAEMIDALGLAETTPGPLILVTQFVAMLAGFAEGGITRSIAAGALTLWVTFIPCFLWIFAAAPYLDTIAARPRLAAALQAITAAIVGVILNLALWFALHVFFASQAPLGNLALPVPDLSSIDLRAVALTALAGVLLLWARRDMVLVLALMAGAGVLIDLT
jgi:chromate transporter